MTVYVEFIFISNAIIDAFLGVFTLVVLRGKVRAIRIILFSLIGAIISCVYPLVGNYGTLLKIVCLFILPIFLIKIDKFRIYCTVVATFSALSFGLGGVVLALNVAFGSDLTFIAMTYSKIPLVISSGGLIVLIVYALIKKNVRSVTVRNKNTYRVCIGNDNGFCNCKAFYDTGNRVYTNYGERVILVSENVYNMLMPAEEETVFISTPSGEDHLSVTDAEILIYFPSGSNKIYSVKAGKGRIRGDIPVILHSDMAEE